jgi:hypothetical protein
MTARRGWVLALAWAALLLGSCDTNPVEPGTDDLSLAANPGNPLNLTADPVSPFQIDLGWDDMSAREDGFDLYRSTNGRAGEFTLFFRTQPNAIEASDFGRIPATEYCYKVLSFRITGRKEAYSGFSNTACATTLDVPPPNAPSALYAIPYGSTAVEVLWTDNSTDETGFKVERASAPGGPWDEAASTSYTGFYDTGLTSDTQVCYRVIAVKFIAVNVVRVSAPSNVDCTAPPAAPVLEATVLEATTSGVAIQLKWTPSSVADGYEVRRRFEYCYPWGYYYYYYCTEYYSIIATILDPTETRHLDENVLPGESHSYYVVALKDGGQSDLSNIASASIPP